MNYHIKIHNTYDDREGDRVMCGRELRTFLFHFILEVLEMNKEHPDFKIIAQKAGEFLSLITNRTRKDRAVEISLKFFQYEIEVEEVKLQ